MTLYPDLLPAAARSITTMILMGTAPCLRASCTFATAADTFITEHPSYGATSNHGAGASLVAIGSPGYLTYPLVRFDLASLAGGTVSGTARLHLYLTGGHPGSESVPREVSVHEILVPWIENEVIWTNFGSQPGVQTGSDISAPVSSTNVDWAGGQAGFYAWELPAALVQKWIDQPDGNFGLLLNNPVTAFRHDLGFSSRESGLHPAPRLEITLSPRTGLTALQQWRTTHFEASDASDLRANDADYDHDGVPNFVEYVTGTNPALAEPGLNSATGLTILPLPTSGSLVQCRFVLNNAAMCDPKVRLTLQHTTNPESGWDTLTSRTGEGAWSDLAPTIDILATSTTHLFSTGLTPQNDEKLFLRIKLEELP